MTPSAPSSEDFVQPERGTLHLWFGMLGAPVTWSVHFLAVYGISEAGCIVGLHRISLLGIDLLTALTLAVTLVSLGVLIASGRVAWRVWHETSAERRGRSVQAERHAYMGLSGILLSGLFLAVTVLETLPVLVLNPHA